MPEQESSSRLQASALQHRLLQLSNAVGQAEAAHLANAAVEQSTALAERYRAVRPAWFHNVLVVVGLRERGLCYDWATDLFLHLHALRLKSLKLHLAVAHLDTIREHNAIVVTARGQAFADGIVLDAWRDSGRLYWSAIAADEYPWQPLPRDAVPPELAKFFLE